MSVSKEDVMDRMVENILGREDAKYVIDHYLMVKAYTKLRNIYGQDSQVSIKRILAYPYSKFVVSISSHGIRYEETVINTDILILCQSEITYALRLLKDKVVSHKQQHLKSEAYKKQLAERQQIKLQELYDNYA